MSRATRGMAAVGALLLLGAAPAPGSSVGSTAVRTFALPRDPMLVPTSVAVDTTGRVWVADGARDRVLVFAADGSLSQTVKRAAGVNLDRPMGVAAGKDGRVWIADAGNQRLVAMAALTTAEQAYPVAKELGKVDLTDVEVSADGARAWAVDNDGHRLLALDVTTGKWTSRGGKGTAWGSFNHPRSVAADAQGRTYVTDVLNGRVQRLEVDARSARPMAKYGVSPGQVFRPSGVDVEAGRMWVADSVLGVIQVFTEDGAYIDAVRDARGEVLHLDGPLGVDVSGDKLFVVESKAAKVTELRLGPSAAAPLVAGEVKTTSKTASEGQECTLCHLDLIAPLDAGVATALVAVPEKKNGASWAGRELACMSCHDGAVKDSREHIWSGFSHPTKDAKIPTTMTIPPDIPLEDGKIGCRTCHTPHTLGGSGQQHRGAVFMRVEARPNELCVACHGPKGGMP